MKRLVVGFTLGYISSPFIREYKFCKEHPEHPRAEEFQAHLDKIKNSFGKLKDEIKRSWAESEQTMADRETFKEMTKDWGKS